MEIKRKLVYENVFIEKCAIFLFSSKHYIIETIIKLQEYTLTYILADIELSYELIRFSFRNNIFKIVIFKLAI